MFNSSQTIINTRIQYRLLSLFIYILKNNDLNAIQFRLIYYLYIMYTKFVIIILLVILYFNKCSRDSNSIVYII